MTKLRVLFMKRVFSYVNYNNVYGRWITTQYLRQIKENSRLNNSGFNKWLEIFAEKNYKQNCARPRTSTLNSGRATAQRRQTLQLNTEDVKRQQQNTTITLQTKPTKRGNTDYRCFSKMRSIEFATKRRGIIERQVYSQNYPFLDTMIGLGSKNYTICKIDMRSIFPADWGQPISLFTVLQ